MKDAGRTVLLSSHILAQVEVLADRVSIIRQGRIVESGSLAELRHLHRVTMTVETSQPTDILADLDGVHGFEPLDGQVRFEVDGNRVDETVRTRAAGGPIDRGASLDARAAAATPSQLRAGLPRSGRCGCGGGPWLTSTRHPNGTAAPGVSGDPAIQRLVPGAAVFAIAMAAFVMLAFSVSLAGEQGVLKRLHGTPLPAWAYLAGRILSVFWITTITITIMLAAGWLLYDTAPVASG